MDRVKNDKKVLTKKKYNFVFRQKVRMVIETFQTEEAWALF